MILYYSRNVLQRSLGIGYFHRMAIATQTGWAALVFTTYHYLEFNMEIAVVPVTILGGALAIFLGFRNNSAYDRWWEARKIWGAIVNVSRNFGTQVVAYMEDKEAQNIMVRRHLAWLHALDMHLRKHMDLDRLKGYLRDDLLHMLASARNVPVQILHRQGQVITEALRQGHLTEFQHSMLMADIRTMYEEQGKAERIKNTVFPYYYNYFTRVFLWVFILALPCALVASMNWLMIPITGLVAFVFYILDQTGNVTEEPFENRAADIPISSIVRTIEIDLLQQIEAEDIPDHLPINLTRFGAAYIK